MIKKAFLGLFALVLLVPTGFLAFEHFRGRSQLDAVLADLKAKGEILDIALIAPKPVSPASNAIDAFVAAADLAKIEGEISPPVIQMIGPGRAIPGTRRTSWQLSGGRPMDWEKVGEMVTARKEDLDALRESLQAPVRQPDLDYSKGFGLLLPHLAKMKSATVVLGLTAADAARRGDFDAALRDLRAGQQVGEDLANQPLLIDQLVRIACQAIITGRAWEILHTRDWTEPQLAALQQAVPSIDLTRGISHALTGERAIAFATLKSSSLRQLTELGDASGSDGNSPSGGPSLLGGALGRVVMFAWRDQALAHYLRTIQRLIESSRDAAAQHSARPLIETRHLIQPASGFAPLSHARTFFARMILPALEKSATKALRAETERDLLVTGIALRRHQLRHGRLPTTLQQLVPEFLPAVPLDRMDGAALRYRTNPDGSFALWSTGDDQVDDGGDSTLPRDPGSGSRNVQWWLAKDAVWPLPATETDAAAWLKATEDTEKRRRSGGSDSPTQGMSPELMKRYGLTPPAPEPAVPATEPVPADAPSATSPAPTPER